MISHTERYKRTMTESRHHHPHLTTSRRGKGRQLRCRPLPPRGIQYGSAASALRRRRLARLSHYVIVPDEEVAVLSHLLVVGNLTQCLESVLPN